MDTHFFSAVKVGDWVRVVWPNRKRCGDASSCYGEAGEVVQVCPAFIVVQTAKGFRFCVSRADVIEGVQLKVNGKKASVVNTPQSGLRIAVLPTATAFVNQC